MCSSDLASEADVDKMVQLGQVMEKACLCGLGQAAPSPILTTVRHFRHEYQRKLLAAGVH